MHGRTMSGQQQLACMKPADYKSFFDSLALTLPQLYMSEVYWVDVPKNGSDVVIAGCHWAADMTLVALPLMSSMKA
jgi:hypothetical protein